MGVPAFDSTVPASSVFQQRLLLSDGDGLWDHRIGGGDADGLGEARGLSDGLLGDVHLGADADDVIELDYIGRTHPDATEAGGRADLALLGGAVDVDVAVVCIAVAGLEAAEPEDARDDGVAARGVGLENFAGLVLVFEDGASGGVATDFSGDLEFAERGAAAAGAIAEAEFGGRDLVLRDGVAILEDEHALLGDADDDAVIGVLLSATREEENEETEEAESEAGSGFQLAAP
jgi:hypothetical protein